MSRTWLVTCLLVHGLSVPATAAPKAQSSPPAAKAAAKPVLKCGDEGEVCCEHHDCEGMLACVHGRCQESGLTKVFRNGGSYTDERGYTTKVESSGDFSLMTFSERGRLLSATLDYRGTSVWSSNRERSRGPIPATLEAAKKLYLAAEPHFDEEPLVRLNLVNVSFQEAAEFFMKLSHQKFDLSYPCGGKLTFVSDEEIKPSEAFSVFHSALWAFQLQMENPAMPGPTIHSGNVARCACALDESVVTRAFVLKHLTKTALSKAPEPLVRDLARQMVSERVFVATEQPEVIRQIGFWLEKQDRLDESGNPVFLPDPLPRSKPYGVCPIAF